MNPRPIALLLLAACNPPRGPIGSQGPQGDPGPPGVCGCAPSLMKRTVSLDAQELRAVGPNEIDVSLLKVALWPAGARLESVFVGPDTAEDFVLGSTLRLSIGTPVDPHAYVDSAVISTPLPTFAGFQGAAIGPTVSQTEGPLQFYVWSDKTPLAMIQSGHLDVEVVISTPLPW